MNERPTLREPLVPVGDDHGTLRRAFASFPTGVAAICAKVAGDDVGFVVSSFSVGVSLSPALVTFAVQKSSSTWPRLASAPSLGVSILADDQADTCAKLAAKHGDRFEGIDRTSRPSGAILIADAATWFECHVHSVSDAGDHDLIILQVESTSTNVDKKPLVFHESRFHGLAAHG